MKREAAAMYRGTGKGCVGYLSEIQTHVSKIKMLRTGLIVLEMNKNAFDKLTSFLTDLERREISYTLAHNRHEAITVSAVVPGERWGIEFLDDGLIEVERFISNGEVRGEEILTELFARDAAAEDRRAKLERFEELLAKVPDVEPEEYDKL